MAVLDLHAHVRMDRACPLFRGRAGEEPAEPGASLLRNQLSLADFRSADVRLVAAAAYAFPLFAQCQGGNLRSLLGQLEAIREWASSHEGVRLVSSPEEAARVLASREHLLGVLPAVEGTHGIESEEALAALWEAGVRLITIAHLRRKSPWAGAAAVRYGPLNNCRPGGPALEARNPDGLSPLGRRLLPKALARGFLIDLSHSSDRTFWEISRGYPGLPLLFTHHVAREITPCERAADALQLKRVGESGGMFGLTFSSDIVGPDISHLLRHARLIAKGAGEAALAFGSDYNGFIPRIPGLESSRGYARAREALEKEGFAALGRSAEAFVGMWGRALAFGGSLSLTPRP